MWRALRSLWDEPAAPRPPGRAPSDQALAALFVLATLAEGLLAADAPGRPVAVGIGIVVAASIAFRRSHPMVAFAVALGVLEVSMAVELTFEVAASGTRTSAAFLLTVYSLYRWGTGRQMAVGVVMALGGYALLAAKGDVRTGGDALAVALLLLAPAALGTSARFRAAAQARELEHVKLRERQLLARELHDIVAHHVSAIAIQAQAGLAVAPSRPEVAMSTLQRIQDEANRTLTELRTMVSALRDEDPAELAPRAGLAEIARLGDGIGTRVSVELGGDLNALPAGVEAALYRMAQEAITNAVRHARCATSVDVRIVGTDAEVHMTISDDGEAIPPRREMRRGFGLLGMAERAALLGGTFEAGRGAERGWLVHTTLPRRAQS